MIPASLRWLEALGAPAASLVIPINPIPASRPKVGRWGAYYPKPYTDWMYAAKQHVRRGTLFPEENDAFLVQISSFRAKPRTSKLTLPIGDVDNYAKGPMDLLTVIGGYWLDDKQVRCLISSKDFAPEGRTEINIWRL